MISSAYSSRASTGVSTALRLVGLVDRERVVRDQLVRARRRCGRAARRGSARRAPRGTRRRAAGTTRRARGAAGRGTSSGRSRRVRGRPHNHPFARITRLPEEWPPPTEGTVERCARRREAYVPARPTLPSSATPPTAAAPARCGRPATQTVFGEGAASGGRDASSASSRATRRTWRGGPFVGPAGRVLDEALEPPASTATTPT